MAPGASPPYPAMAAPPHPPRSWLLPGALLDKEGAPLVVILGRHLWRDTKTSEAIDEVKAALANYLAEETVDALSILYVHTGVDLPGLGLGEYTKLVTTWSALPSEQRAKIKKVCVLHPSFAPRFFGTCLWTLASVLRPFADSWAALADFYAARVHYIDRLLFLDDHVNWRAAPRDDDTREDDGATRPSVVVDEHGDADMSPPPPQGSLNDDAPKRVVVLPHWVVEHDNLLEKDPLIDYGFATGSVDEVSPGALGGGDHELLARSGQLA